MRMRDLTLRYMNEGSLSLDDQDAISTEFGDLRDELNRITQTTSFAGEKLLNGVNNSLSFQVGAISGEAISVQLPKLDVIQAEDGNVEPIRASYIVYKPRSSVDEWRSLPGDRYRIAISDGDSRDFLSIKLDGGSNLNDLASSINSQFGDKMKAFVDYIEVQDPNNSEGKKEVKRLNYYALDGSSVSLYNWGQKLSHPNNLIGAGSVRGSYYLDPENNESTAIPLLGESGDAETVLEQLDTLLQHVDSERTKLGAVQNRLSHAINNLSQSSENIAASNSQIRDTDFAKETSELTKQSILKQVGTSMLAQASQTPQSALSLLS